MLRGASALAIAAAAFGWGAATIHYHVFPYDLIAGLNDRPADRTALDARLHSFEILRTQADIVLLGDSLVAQGEWSELLVGHAVANRGVGGEGFDDIARRVDDVLALKPEVVVLAAGINDSGRAMPDVLANYRNVLDQLAGTRVIVMAVPLCRCDRRDWAERLNLELQREAEARGLQWLDLNPALAPEGIVEPRYTYDGTHLTIEGYLAWRDALSALL